MVYALTFSITAFFILLYIILRKPDRERHYFTLSDEEYRKECKRFVHALPLPQKSGSTNDKRYKRTIRFLSKKLKMKRYKGIFDDFLENIKTFDILLKTDYSALENVASVNGEARCVALARFCLANSDYIFTNDRFRIIAECQNRFRSLTFAEILSMKEAFLYVLLEKLYFIYMGLDSIARVMKYAKAYVFDGGNSKSKKLKGYSRSKLFLSLCAIEIDCISEGKQEALREVIDELYTSYSHVLRSIGDVLCFDFSRFYSPLEIYDKFSSFSNADENAKEAFLKLAASLSDKENLDEFMYAIRVEKYMQSASAGHIAVARGDFLGKRFSIIKCKKDISLIGLGLKSDFLMRALFSQNKNAKKKNTISKFIDFENSFEPIYKFNNINFGISTQNGALKILPRLPNNVVRADVRFVENGVEHALHVIRGDKEEIYLGSTRLKGTGYIRLSDKPLDVTVVVEK